MPHPANSNWQEFSFLKGDMGRMMANASQNAITQYDFWSYDLASQQIRAQEGWSWNNPHLFSAPDFGSLNYLVLFLKRNQCIRNLPLFYYFISQHCGVSSKCAVGQFQFLYFLSIFLPTKEPAWCWKHVGWIELGQLSLIYIEEKE